MKSIGVSELSSRKMLLNLFRTSQRGNLTAVVSWWAPISGILLPTYLPFVFDKVAPPVRLWEKWFGLGMLATPLNLSITFRALLNAKSSFISAFLDKNIAQFGPLQLWPSICFDLTGSHCSAFGWWGNSPDPTAIFCSSTRTYFLDTWTPLSFDPLKPCFIDLTSTRMRCCYLVCWGHELPVCLWRQLDSQLDICDEFFRHWRRLKSSKAVLTVSMREGKRLGCVELVTSYQMSCQICMHTAVHCSVQQTQRVSNSFSSIPSVQSSHTAGLASRFKEPKSWHTDSGTRWLLWGIFLIFSASNRWLFRFVHGLEPGPEGD